MEPITGIFADKTRFGQLLTDAQKKLAAKGIKAGVVAMVDEEGTFHVDWVGPASQALGLAGRWAYEINRWLDE